MLQSPLHCFYLHTATLIVAKISRKKEEKVEDVLSVGDDVTVKVIEIDNQGRINLSMKDLEVTNA